MSELLRALGTLCEPPAAEHARVAESLGLPGPPDASSSTHVFVLQLPPYASLYLGPEGMLGGAARDRIAGFWRAVGLVPPPEPDHLAALLGLYASLSDDERAQGDGARRALRRQARAALLHEHLLSWLGPWLARVAEVAGPWHRAWATLLTAALQCEADELLIGDEPLPVHLRAAEPLQPPGGSGGRGFLDGLLAPARSGLLLVADDLARAAHDLGLGRRVAERRYVLRHLLGQDAAAVLGWLEHAARSAAQRLAGVAPIAVAREWNDRAAITAAVLADAGALAQDEEMSRAG